MGVVEFTIANSCARPLDVTVALDAGKDSKNWESLLGHRHFTLNPSVIKTIKMPLQRSPGNLDKLSVPSLKTQIEYLTDNARVQLGVRQTTVPLSLDLDKAAASITKSENCLVVKEPMQAIAIPDEYIQIASDSPLTLGASVRPFDLKGHNGIVAKTQNSGYALFSSDGVPEFSIYLGDGYVTASASKPMQVGKWTHLAGVYDGTSVKLFVDGKLVATQAASGKRRVNQLPLFVGADPDKQGKPTRPFKTLIDNVRLTPAAVYTADFDSNKQVDAREDSLLWLDFNESLGPFVVDRGKKQRRSVLRGPSSELISSPAALVK